MNQTDPNANALWQHLVQWQPATAATLAQHIRTLPDDWPLRVFGVGRPDAALTLPPGATGEAFPDRVPEIAPYDDTAPLDDCPACTEAEGTCRWHEGYAAGHHEAVQAQLDAVRVNPGMGLREFMRWQADVEEAEDRGEEPPVLPAAVVSPPTDRADLRDRIAALFRHPPGVERLGDATPGEVADAVLSVLGEQADRAAVRAEALLEAAEFVGNDDDCDCGGCDTCVPRQLAEGLRRLAVEAHDTGTQQPEPVVTVHAAPNLSPAAEEALGALVDVAKQQAACDFEHPHPEHPCGRRVQPSGEDVAEAHRLALSEALHLGNGAPWQSILDRAGDLSRRAAEAQQQPDTEAQPPCHRWYTEQLDPVANEWAPGWRFTDRAEAVERYRILSEHGTPAERRLVRETTTYTVEEPAPVAQQHAAEPAADLIEDYLKFLRGEGLEPDLSDLPAEHREAITGQFEIVKALADRDPELPPLAQDPVARRLGLQAPEQQPAAEDTCRPVDVDGEIIRVRGAAEMSDESRAALAEVIAAVKRRYAAEHPETEQQAAAADGEETPSRAVLLDLVRDFLDPDPCSFDHHGYCQAHGYLGGEPGSCPHGRARKLIPGIDDEPPTP